MSFVEVVADQHLVYGWSVSDRGSHRPRSHVAGSVLWFGVFDSSPASVRSAVNDVNDVTVVESATCMWTQITQQFDLVVINGHTVAMTTPEACRAVVHAAVQHLSPGGWLVASFALHDPHVESYGKMCAEFNLESQGREIDAGVCIVHRRTRQTTIHDLVFEARSRITRVEPAGLRRALDSQHPPTIIDTRTNTDRERFGVIRGSIHVPRTTLEWACDPSNGYRHPEIRSHDQSLVIVCSGGYSSSLAAANLALLGFRAVSDLIGGHQAWVRAGYEVARPDHTSLDY